MKFGQGRRVVFVYKRLARRREKMVRTSENKDSSGVLDNTNVITACR